MRMPLSRFAMKSECRVSSVECRGEETDVVPGPLLMLLVLTLGRPLMIAPAFVQTKSAGIRTHSKRSAIPDAREAYGLRRLPPLFVVFVFVRR
jgi:hypothetical protein